MSARSKVVCVVSVQRARNHPSAPKEQANSDRDGFGCFGVQLTGEH